VQEPKREDADVADAPAPGRAATPEPVEAKAYAFDGWGMVPLDPVA
jgi:hypothetical protein